MATTAKIAIALLVALVIMGMLVITGPDGDTPREGNPCAPISDRYGDLRCIEVWNPWEGDTGRGMWSTGNVDGKYRP